MNHESIKRGEILLQVFVIKCIIENQPPICQGNFGSSSMIGQTEYLRKGYNYEL